jgi:hypothetical protein
MPESPRQIRLYCAVPLVTNVLIGTCVWIAFKPADLPDAAGWGVAAAVFTGLVFWGVLLGVWGLFLGPALVVLIKVLECIHFTADVLPNSCKGDHAAQSHLHSLIYAANGKGSNLKYAFFEKA